MNAYRNIERRTGQEGVTSVVAALLILAVMGFVALGVDVSYIHLKRSSLQTAADSGALAGANALISYGNDLDKVRDVVINYTRANLSEKDRPDLAISQDDISFLRDGVEDMQNPNQVEVKVRLNHDRDNQLDLFVGPVLGVEDARVGATSRATAAGVCSSKCIKPFVLPAKFTWNDRADKRKSKYYNNGKFDPRSRREVDSVQVLGYSEADLGTRLIIKPGDPKDAIVPGQYNLIDLPPVNKGTPRRGACMVKKNIVSCEGSNGEAAVEPNDELLLEPGNKVGPVRYGAKKLYYDDYGAYWDAGSMSIKGSKYADPMESPRVILMAFYDPSRPPQSGRNSVFVHQLGAMFIETVDNRGTIIGRFIEAIAVDPDYVAGNCTLRLSRMVRDSSRKSVIGEIGIIQN